MIRYVVGVKSMVKMFKMAVWMTDTYLDKTFAKKSWPSRYAKDIPAK
jgi:hypothetical protein